MKNNKAKKTYLTVMTLVLAITMAISSSITLAFFGSATKKSATIKMTDGLAVDSTVTMTSPEMAVVPSQNVDLVATAKVKPYKGTGTIIDGILRAKVETSVNVPGISLAIIPSTTVDGKTLYWKEAEEGVYYLMSTDSLTGTLAPITPTAEGKTCDLRISAMVSSTITNEYGGSKFSVKVSFCVVQSKIYDETGVTTITNTIENTKDVFASVAGETTPNT